jgi:hypothetical protein
VSGAKDGRALRSGRGAREAARRLQDAGIIDALGRRIRKNLRPDMQEDQDRDFGG